MRRVLVSYGLGNPNLDSTFKVKFSMMLTKFLLLNYTFIHTNLKVVYSRSPTT